MNNKFKAQINQQVLEKLGESDEFFQEVVQESKPSRIDSRRQKAVQHQQKKTRRRVFEEYND